jgi:transposase
MDISTLLADPVALRLEYVKSAPQVITLVVKAVQPSAACPRCQCASARVHSRYTRTAADLPWHGIAVRLRLHTRRFRCTHDLCPQRIFCERLPQVAARYARKTARLNDALQFIGFIIGGEAGARAALRLGMSVSPDTLIRRVRQAALPPTETPRVLGVDDWAKRKGQRYGTILIDLERRRPVDLLPDRESETLAAWLKAHPGVEVVTRDRARAYAEGVTAGAPDALQVADRWHILKNLTEALERLLTRQHHFVREAAAPTTPPPQPPPTPQPQVEAPLPRPTFLPPSRPHPGVAARRDKALALYTEAVRLKGEGLSAEEVAPLVGKSRRTVHRWLQMNGFRERTRCRRSALDAHLPHIITRWEEGCRNVSELWRELVECGYGGSYVSLNKYLHRKPGPPPAAQPQGGKSTRVRPDPPLMSVPSPRRAVWMLLKPEGLKEAEPQVVENLCRLSPEVAQATGLARRFFQMVRERQADQLKAWITEVEGSQLPELKAFARGLGQDWAAIEAVLREEWSNGQTEGQVHRLKLLKRQMYGRAKFDLLRAKVLYAA